MNLDFYVRWGLRGTSNKREPEGTPRCPFCVLMSGVFAISLNTIKALSGFPGPLLVRCKVTLTWLLTSVTCKISQRKLLKLEKLVKFISVLSPAS